MSSIVTLSGAVAGALLLLTAGILHVRAPREFRAALAGHRILPFRWQRTTARLLPAVEIIVGAVALTTIVTGLPGATPALAALCFVYATFTAYSYLLLRRGNAAACGCFGGREPVTLATVLRNALLAVTAAGSLIPAVTTPTGPALALTLAVGLVVAVLGWMWPALFRP
ncbi:MauE/DoxX family redox-associated membrane protein [Micromonospora sp. WMMD964]|uniref:MauE/DoxX family redox-associated membrane protein n=1 Tax=Micromonospora sp. WMMD964 TaxID=3016091 RepID=UPI00249C71A6|nr:MauE/DoxX family redox-associated membrane protein [Micromonospora sp. WMMD964]WFF02991.1 MauE/DoxX family redox-associated membrane protein [Micromonospora sp. WMMD964]